MSVVTQMGNGIAMTEYENGSISFVRNGFPFGPPLSSKADAVAFARAILGALGEPVDAKPEPDRSELDQVESDRWVVTRNGSVVSHHGRFATLDALITNLKKRGGGTIYESKAWVEPEPAERKVVRL